MKGFTLLEVVAVAVVVGILAALGIPSFVGYLQRQRLNAATQAVASDLRQAQKSARNASEGVTVVFGSDSYSIGGTTITLPEGMSASPGAISYDSRGFPGPEQIPFRVQLQSGALSRCIDMSAIVGSIRTGNCDP